MRAIIIDDKDASAFVDMFDLERRRQIELHPEQKNAIEEIFRGMRYRVVVWLQEQGAREFH